MPRLHQEWAISAIIVPFKGGEPCRCSIEHSIIGDMAWAYTCMGKLLESIETRERAPWSIKPSEFQIHGLMYLVWDTLEERYAAERAKHAELVAGRLRVDPAVKWSVDWDRPGEAPQLRLACGGIEMLVDASQEAVDRACANPMLVDRSIGSLGGSWWDEED